MTDVIELSSDEDYSKNTNKNDSDGDTTVDTDIGDTLEKYKPFNNDDNTQSSKITKETISSSDDDEYDNLSNLRSLRERLELKYKLPSTSKNTDLFFEEELKSEEPKNNYEDYLSQDSQFSDESENIEPSKLKRRAAENLKKLENEQEKARKQIKYKLPSTSKSTDLFFEEDNPWNDPKDDEDYFSQPSTQNSQLSDESEPSKPKKRRPTSAEDKNLKKLEKEQEKARKQAEKEQKKAETAAAKAEKQAIASAYKNLKPDECIKFITAIIDSELMSTESGTDIPNVLQNSKISYKVSSNIHPNTITWKRNNQAQLTNIDGQLRVTKNEDHCEEVLLILLWNEFVKSVHENSLSNKFKSIQSVLPGKKIFLAIYGIDNYFKAHKSQKQTKTGKDRLYLASPKISRKDADMSLIELQLLYGASHRFLETPQDVSALVLQFSKAIAQIPYKLQKQQKQQQMDWYVSGDNKDCVRVDKNGNGLHRLWQQQLTQFTMARLEHAEAITSKFPSPAALMKAYEECQSKEEGEKLLQEIPIRRAAGPLTSVRKIGPEFSKKIYTLFTSLDGDTQL